MKELYGFFDKHIVGGKGFLAFSICYALLVRILFLFNTYTIEPSSCDGGWLWNLVTPFLSNSTFSIFIATVFLGVIAFLIHYINVQFTLIRRKTLLSPAFVLLLFSSSPSFLTMSPLYIGTLTILVVISDIFGGYNSTFKQRAALRASFHLSLGSLFIPFVLIFFPLVWHTLNKVKSMNFKAFLATIFGIILIYIPMLTFLVVTGDIESFLTPFTSLSSVKWSDFPFYSYGLIEFLFWSIAIILFFIILTDNQLNRHKDKVSARIFLYVLSCFFFFSLLGGFFIAKCSLSFIAIAMAMGSLLLAHFFALMEHKSIATVFLSLLVFFIITSLYSFI